VINLTKLTNKRINKTKIFLSDTKSFFAKNHAWILEGTDRNARWAIVVEKDGSISYVGNEPGKGVTVS
jgi:hypothetical protein